MRKTMIMAVLLLGSAAGLEGCRQVKQAFVTESKPRDTIHPEQVYWGDTHLHTANSPDAFGFGNRLDPEAALRFARGEEDRKSVV